VTAREQGLRMYRELSASGDEVVEAQIRLGVERARASDLASVSSAGSATAPPRSSPRVASTRCVTG
jgi:hypothetical protein